MSSGQIVSGMETPGGAQILNASHTLSCSKIGWINVQGNGERGRLESSHDGGEECEKIKSTDGEPDEVMTARWIKITPNNPRYATQRSQVRQEFKERIHATEELNYTKRTFSITKTV